MSATEHEPLVSHVEPPLDAARLDRQWARIRSGTSRVARLRPVLRASAAGLALAAAAASFFLGRVWTEAPSVTLAEGSVIETSDDATEARLVDGSEVALAAASRLEIAEADVESDVEVVLSRGAATFEVTRNPRRTFTVRAGEVRVVVVGTRFSVTRAADGSARVDVERGIVEVHRGEAVSRLTAGQSWSEPDLAPADVHADDAPLDVEATLDQVPEAVVEAAADEAAADEAVVAVAPSVSPRPAPDARGDARALFESARAARRAGDAAEAERLYALLLAQHPRDARAGVVAFELGRLRMDVLGDDEGAVDPLSRSIRGRAAASYREDAMARLALAHDRLGHARACASARDAYLAEFPTGVHTAVVSALCR